MSAEPGIGKSFAGHSIIGELGRGGMGVVYEARHEALDQPRAVKVVADELAEHDHFQARFQREARLAASVSHPNVVTVHHAGREDGRLFLSMSLVNGPDLSRLVAESGRIDPPRVGRLISQIAAGLDAAHAAGLVHRDVKPSNVIVEHRDGDERAVITDFGLSRLVEDDAGMTVTGEFMGSTDFVAPEVVEGEDVDARADVYSLGAIAYYLLAGEPPFANRSPAAKLVAHVNADRPEPSAMGAPVSVAVDDAVVRAMAVDREERFQTPSAFADAFADAVAAGGTFAAASQAANPLVGVVTVGLAAASVSLLLLVGGEAKRKHERVPIERAGRAAQTIAVGDGPTALTTQARNTWVAARDDGVVQAIPVQAHKPNPERAVALGNGSEPVSVAVGFDSIWIIDQRSDSLVRAPLEPGPDPVVISLEGDPKDVTVSPHSVWVAEEEADAVAQIDPKTNEVENVLPVCDGPRSVSFGDGGVWAACIEAGTVLRIDAGAAEVQGKPIAAGTRPNDVAVGEDGVWVIDNLEGVVRRIDPKTEVADDPIDVGARPRGIAATLGSVWIANSEDGTVTRIDESERRQYGEPIEVGAEPADISVGGGSIWTSNFADDTVTRIEP